MADTVGNHKSDQRYHANHTYRAFLLLIHCMHK